MGSGSLRCQHNVCTRQEVLALVAVDPISMTMVNHEPYAVLGLAPCLAMRSNLLVPLCDESWRSYDQRRFQLRSRSWPSVDNVSQHHDRLSQAHLVAEKAALWLNGAVFSLTHKSNEFVSESLKHLTATWGSIPDSHDLIRFQRCSHTFDEEVATTISSRAHAALACERLYSLIVVG